MPTEAINEILSGGPVCIFMKTGQKWVMPNGIVFSRESPYQLVEEVEATRLLENNPQRFRKATREEVLKFYDLI